MLPVDKSLCLSDHPSHRQESREGYAGPSSPPGHHLYAVLCQPGGGRDLSNRLHIFQLVFGVLPGIIQHPNDKGSDILKASTGRLGCPNLSPVWCHVCAVTTSLSGDDCMNVTRVKLLCVRLKQDQGVDVFECPPFSMMFCSSLYLLPPLTQGFFVSVFYCFLNSEVSRLSSIYQFISPPLQTITYKTSLQAVPLSLLVAAVLLQGIEWQSLRHFYLGRN